MYNIHLQKRGCGVVANSAKTGSDRLFYVSILYLWLGAQATKPLYMSLTVKHELFDLFATENV